MSTGNRASIWGKLAAAAQANEEAGRKGFSAVAEDLPPGKVPLHRAGNLKKLRKARDGVIMGIVKPEDFEDIVYSVLEVATKAIHTFDLPIVKNVEAGLDPGEVAVFVECRSSLRILLAGLLEMLEFVEHRERAELDKAMEQVEEAMERVAKAQDMAIEQNKKAGAPPVA